MTKQINYFLGLVLVCMVVFIACNKESSDQQELDQLITTETIDDQSTVIGVPVVWGSPLDDPHCRLRRYTDGTYYCEGLTPCGGGQTCKVMAAVGGFYCDCK